MKHPFLISRPSGFFHVAYPDEYTGKRKYVTTNSKVKSEANKFLAEFKEKKKQESEIKYISLQDFGKLFLELSTDKGESTMQNYKAVIKQLIFFHGNRVLQQYSLKDIDEFLKHKENTTSVHTAGSYRKCLNVLFQKALMYNYLSRNIIPLTVKFRLPEPDPHPMTKSEFKALLNSIQIPLYKDLFLFAVLTGMRMGELINLKPSQIDLDRKCITVISNKSFKTKTGKSRKIDLHKSLIPIYEKYKHQEYMFLGNRDKLKLNRKWLIKITKRLIRQSGIDSDFSFHTFRSTFGYWLLLEGTHLKYISNQLGHSLQSTTEKHYVKYLDTELMGYVDRIVI